MSYGRVWWVLSTVCLWGVVGHSLNAAGTDRSQTISASPSTNQDVTPEVLVQRLGDAHFVVRKRATDQLIELGIRAVPALEEGVQSGDREIRFRCRMALERVRELDFQRRLRAFAAGHDANESYELPAWPLFRKEVGDGLEARRLFVEMQQSEPALLLALERDPDKIVEVLSERLEKIQIAAQSGGKATETELGTIAALLFVANSCSPGESAGLAAYDLSGLLRQDAFALAVQAGPQQDVLRKLLTVWIERARSWEGFHAVLLAMQYNIPQGLVPARRLLEGDTGDPNESVYRGFALQTFARFGDASHIPIVEPFLEDASPYGGSLSISDKAKYQTQVRDIALATLVFLVDEDPKKFGLNRLKTSSSQVFNTSSVAFEDDAKRAEAIAAWHAFRAEHP